jgi:hypothetical protein
LIDRIGMIVPRSSVHLAEQSRPYRLGITLKTVTIALFAALMMDD